MTATEPAVSPRVERSKAAILAATVELLVEGGVGGLTMDAVACRARVGKATVYRHWEGRGPLIVEAVSSVVPAVVPSADTGSLRDDLLTCYDRMLVACSQSPLSAILPSMVAEAERDPELGSLFRHFSAQRRAPTIAVIERAQARGEIRADLDPQLACDLMAGPVFYKRLVLHDPPDRAYVERLVDLVLAAYR
jgi:AcrR family transcriptional regulator